MYRSEYLYNNIHKLVTDEEVFPICVTSYNRPDAHLLRFADRVPIVLFIRREQEQLYKVYKEKCRIVLLDNVKNVGQTRAAIVNWAYDLGYDNIFMLDDDIQSVNFMIPGKSTTSDKEFMKQYSTVIHIPESVELYFFKMWTWLIKHSDPKLTLSGPGAKSDFWNIANKDRDFYYNVGSVIQCVHLNVKNLVEHDINYESNDFCGVEYYTLQYDIMINGLYTMIYTDLVFRVPSVGSKSGGNGLMNSQELQQKYFESIELFKTNVMQPETSDRVTTKTSKGGIPSIKFIWQRWKIKDNVMRYTIEDVKNEVHLC